LASAAIEAHATIDGRVNNDAITEMQRRIFATHHLADHFVTHDERVTNGDCAFVDVQIGAADTAMRDSDKDLVMSENGPLDFRQGQFSRALQDHCFHERGFRQSVMSYLEILVMGPAVARLFRGGGFGALSSKPSPLKRRATDPRIDNLLVGCFS
jgi:hypothetical protein